MSDPTFYNLVEIGMVHKHGSYTFEREEIIEFASQFDPQPFHLNEDAAKASHFGALCASGWHTISAWMRLNVVDGKMELMALTGSKKPPVLGPSPGVRNIRWTHPVYVGDTISYQSTVTGKRISQRRKGWGLMTSTIQGFNQDGTQVLTMDGSITVRIDQ